ncbi:MAG: DUF2071 domain-containing protein [Nitrospina sp.]|nr:DUF2071 domain-containing protein [Nitrospina sp.]
MTPFNTQHRPWPLPESAWVMTMRWERLLFAHWAVDADTMRQLIPASLQLDTFDGKAWIGVVPFRMAGTRPACLPALPWLSYFPELNVRTYVIRDGKPGVWFFSLDAGNPISVRLARGLFHLPYFDARMSLNEKAGGVVFRSKRTHSGAPPVELKIRYRPVGDVQLAQPGSLDHWLTERYCFYAEDRRKRLFRCDVHHDPWPLQPAKADITACSLASSLGLALSSAHAILHYSHTLAVHAWPLARVG